MSREAIDFARSFMPALAAAAEVARSSGALAGRRVGVALTLEPKTACLVEALADVGAEVAVLGNAWSTKPTVVDALRDAGRFVTRDADELIDRDVELLADDGAVVTRRLHDQRRDRLPHLRGVAEETTSGVRPLRNMAAAGQLAVPVVAVNDARTKLLFDNVYGTGQSVVMAVLDATNMQMAGARVVVVGYGKVGRGIAAMARAVGGRVTVAEVDPVAALAAHHDGLEVAPLADAVVDADFVLTATGIGHTVTAEHLARLPDGAIVAVGGMGRPEVDLSDVELGEEVRPHVRAARAAGGPTVFVVADGRCANTTAGEGNPIEVMDLSLALQLRALDHLARYPLPPGVHLLPPEIDAEVAAAQLRFAGIAIDAPTDAQRTWASSW